MRYEKMAWVKIRYALGRVAQQACCGNQCGLMRAFVRLREILATHEELARKVAQHDWQIAVLFEHVKSLLEPPPASKKRPIGFIHPKD
jgi:hypothetical protein